jgi:hypothetical protein
MVRSPDIAHTYAFASIIDHQLRWIPSERALLASVTFSNVNYVSRSEGRRDERFDFFLPGVRLDTRDGVFYDSDGTPVAKIHREVIGSDIQLLAGTKIYVTNQSGTVHLVLSTSREPRAGLRWVETDQAILIPGRFG